ncbi:MAG: EAL domain-containing protein [Woeseiaceae bacterium]
MIGSKIPRYVVFAAALGAAVALVLLSMFYVQYRWLAQEIVISGAAEHNTLLAQSFERRARAQVHAAADMLLIDMDTGDDIARSLNRSLANNPAMSGLRFSAAGGTELHAGSFPAGIEADGAVVWLPNILVLGYPVERDGQQFATLSAAFPLEQLRVDSAAFEAQLLVAEEQSRTKSYLWIVLGTVLCLLLCGAVVWLLANDQTMRIRALIEQAEKLRNADFGEPLTESGGDELAELAGVFNEMRDKLQSTTLSRDYVDSILAGMNEAIIVTSDDGKIRRINKATTHLLGYEEDELINNSLDFVVNTVKSGSLIDKPPSGLPKEAFLESKFGESVPVSYTCSVIDGDSESSGERIYAAQNTTERRRAEKRIRYLARIDALTKIPNRMQFQHLLQRAIARARKARRPLCMFYVDIDYFKEINDTFGHLAGDTTLETVAQRLSEALPNRSVIGRLAGDEFAVIVNGHGPDAKGKEAVGHMAQKLLNKLADPFFVQGHEVFMTASLGIAFYPQDAPNVIDLIRNADAALYHAKKSGGGKYSFYVPQMNEASVERLMTKSKLKRAFERDELLVHYQPKYNLKTGEVYGAEALVRWELPERGLILPSDFIPIAEETNLIIDIGEWVLDKVCEDFRVWQRSVASAGRVSVNLSLKQLRQRSFIQRINAILRGHEVSPTSLELEITETTLMENPERTIKLLDQLYGLGLHLAIDDFGTGYSSLSALQQFPISTLKIDRSFVRNIVTNPDDATIVDTIIQMGRNMDMDVVAEGVEDEAQLNYLQTLGCTYVQGLLFGEPMSSDNYLELLLAQEDGTDQYRALFA